MTTEMTYSADNPASSLDVAHEVTALVTLIATSIQTTLDPEVATQRMQDIATPEGAKVAEAEVRLSVALETWLGESQQFLSSAVVSGLSKPLMDRLSVTHDALHGR